MKQQFIINTSDTFKTYIYENNRKAVASSASITLFKPASGTRIADGAPMSIGEDGLLSYSLSQADNSMPATDYKAVITYVHNSKTCYAMLFYDVVNSKLTKVITDEDIIAELPQLREKGWSVRGEAESGSATSIIDSELGRYEADYFTGGLAYSVDKDETREVTGFTQSGGTVTTVAFSSAISAGEKYILTRSFSKEIQRAFEKIEERIIRLGRRPELILDPYDLREAHIFQSVAEVCKGLVTDNENFWWEIWKDYEKKAEETFRAINFKYDSSNDGYIACGEKDDVLDVIRAGRR